MLLKEWKKGFDKLLAARKRDDRPFRDHLPVFKEEDFESHPLTGRCNDLCSRKHVRDVLVSDETLFFQGNANALALEKPIVDPSG